MKDWGGILSAAAAVGVLLWLDHHMTKTRKLLGAILESLQENGSRLDSIEEKLGGD